MKTRRKDSDTDLETKHLAVEKGCLRVFGASRKGEGVEPFNEVERLEGEVPAAPVKNSAGVRK